jgi:hypothetical protein
LEIIVFSCHFFLQFFLLLQISRLHWFSRYHWSIVSFEWCSCSEAL